MKFLAYHRTADGREWGPFTMGQITGLWNAGVINGTSEMRAAHADEWVTHPLQWSKRFFPHGIVFPEPENGYEDVTDEEEAHGEAQVQALMRHQAALRASAWSGGPPPLPFDFDVKVPEEWDLAFTGWERIEHPLSGVELTFKAGDEARAWLRWMPVEGDALKEACDQVVRIRAQEAVERCQSRIVGRADPLMGPWPNPTQNGMGRTVMEVRDERPVIGSVKEGIREWWSHVAEHGAVWEVEFFFLKACYWENERRFAEVIRVWPPMKDEERVIGFTGDGFVWTVADEEAAKAAHEKLLAAGDLPPSPPPKFFEMVLKQAGYPRDEPPGEAAD